ncbi:MAG: SDR family NAD(P)-dependent oxidoreductase [Pseudomonadota bacterium]
MSLPIQDQTVLITGAGRGLGAAIARAFAREGTCVAVNYRRSREAAEGLAAEIGSRAITIQADVTDSAAVADMVARMDSALGAPTTVVHNALADYAFNGDARDTLERDDLGLNREGILILRIR